MGDVDHFPLDEIVLNDRGVHTQESTFLRRVAAPIRLVRTWAKRIDLTTESLGVPFPADHGFEELDQNGQFCLAELFSFNDPPDDLAT